MSALNRSSLAGGVFVSFGVTGSSRCPGTASVRTRRGPIFLLTGGLLSAIIHSVAVGFQGRFGLRGVIKGWRGFGLHKAYERANTVGDLVWGTKEFECVCSDVVPPRAR